MPRSSTGANTLASPSARISDGGTARTVDQNRRRHLAPRRRCWHVDFRAIPGHREQRHPPARRLSNALGASALSNVTLNATTAGATALFDLNGFNQSILALTFGGNNDTATSTNNVSTGAGTLTLGGNVTFSATGNPLGSTLSGNVDLGSATRTFTIGDSTNAPIDLTVSANISGGIDKGLTKAGNGTLLLSGTNTFSGPTTALRRHAPRHDQRPGAGQPARSRSAGGTLSLRQRHRPGLQQQYHARQ